VAPSWLEFEHELETISERPGQLAMNRLDLEPGHTVVDLGCGSGLTTVQLAERVGEAGSALGVDISAELLTEARRRADRHDAGNVEFLAADIQTDHLGEARFDRAYSRFGLMFCADRVAALANLRHTLRPGGRLSFVCFQSVAENEWMLVPYAAALAVTGAAPAAPDPRQPDLFSPRRRRPPQIDPRRGGFPRHRHPCPQRRGGDARAAHPAHRCRPNPHRPGSRTTPHSRR